VYDPRGGHLLREFVAFPEIPDGVADFQLVASPAGHVICLLVAGADDHGEDPRVFDPDSGRPSKLPFPLAGVRHVTFDALGTSVATGAGRGAVVVYDASSGAVRRALTGQPVVTAMAFDPDGRRLVVSGEDRLLRVWDVGTGGLIEVHPGHTGYIARVFVRPIGGEVVSVSTDGTARVWAARAAGPRPWTRHTASLTDLAVSPDGRRVVTASFDGTARVWDAATGAGIHTFRGHTGEVYGVAISPDGRRAATGGEDRTVRFWDLESGACERVVRYESEVHALAFVSAGQILISDPVTSEGPFAPAALFDLATGKVVRRLGHPEASDRETYRLAASRDGRSIAIGFDNGDVVVWSSADDRAPVILRGHGAYIGGLAFFPDGRRLASASADHTGRVWDTATGRAEQELRAHTDSVIALAITPDGRRVVTSGYDGRMIVWDAFSGSDLLRLIYGSPSNWAASLAFGADGTLYADGPDRDVLTWSVWPQTERVFTGHARRVRGLAYLGPDAIVSGDSDGILRVWDPSTGRERRQLVGHTDAVNAVAAFPDGRRVVTAGDDRTVRVWDAVSNRQLLRMPDTATPATALAVSPDGRRVAAAVPGREADGSPPMGEVIIADTDTGEPVPRLPMTGDRAWGIAYAPDGQRLVTACADGKLRLWDPADGRLLAEWAGHNGRVLAVAFSADGRKVASGGDDRLVTLWDAGTGRPVWRRPGHVHQIRAVLFSPDGRLVASAGYDGQVREWDADTGEEVARHATARGSIECMVYGPDGGDIVFGGGDTAVRVRPSARSRLRAASGPPNATGPHAQERR
jgi:WD40 repeat protein